MDVLIKQLKCEHKHLIFIIRKNFFSFFFFLPGDKLFNFMVIITEFPIECLEEIFNNLEKNISSLHSCLLVNRTWCKLIVPILWRWPFFMNIKSPHFIPVYLPFLNK